MKFLVGSALLLLLAGFPAAAADKTEVNIRNLRGEPITMQFSYRFQSHDWTLMSHDVPVGDDVSYRFPIGMPGCGKLKEWGLADGILTVSNKDGVLCERPISLCDRKIVWGDARLERCTWREMPMLQ